jgi:hypothetical protein
MSRFYNSFTDFGLLSAGVVPQFLNILFQPTQATDWRVGARISPRF